ncbi:Rpn family recombination-promoting nuclease/putative transposase [Nocardia sp. 2]|uniref:Rpn family recombination-promoting nuclease/putative transposase n=2 Tax=Nocardia acididurans TaxID=2802282 RepID=A0ABS1MDM2_9NOCA|nr:Rpn family recombination-promoting nuclease/putative transposase [Nocardia acididurans]
MPFRMVEYMVAIWNRSLERHPHAKVLPAIIPLVVHASPKGRRWTYSTELADLIDLDRAAKSALGRTAPRQGR